VEFKVNESVLEILPGGVLIFNEELKVDYLNQTFKDFIGISSEDIFGKPLDEKGIPFQDQRDFLAQELQYFFKTGEASPITQSEENKMYLKEPLTHEITGKKLDPPNTIMLGGQDFVYQFFGLIDPDSKKRKIGMMLTDITKIRIFQEEIMMAEKLAGLRLVSSGMAHEINNPLQVIIAFTEAILNEKDLSKIAKLAKSVLDRATEVSSVVRDLSVAINLSKLDPKDVDVVMQLEKSLHTALLVCHPDDIKITKNYQVSPTIRATPQDIQQIFYSIIHNAILAMEMKGALHLETEQYKNNLIIQIQDSGPGIPREFLSRVFDPFFTTRDQGDGTGLGLSVAHRLTEKYNGKLNILSQTGVGTTFRIIFPI